MASRSPAAGALVTVVAAAVLLGAAVEVQAERERRYPPSAEAIDAPLYLRSGSALRRATGAYTTLFADVYWIRAIQYYGGTKRRLDSQAPHQPAAAAPPAAHADAFPLLFPMLDITTSLDPRFNIAYRFGAIFLAEPYPRGADRPDEAIALLEKGLRAQPDKWQYMQDIGFVHYWFRQDFIAAAEWFKKAGDVPGAPWWLRSLAATTLAQGGDRRSSRAMWMALRETGEIDWLRKEAERRLLQLNALDLIDALQRAADAYTKRTGEPATWPALVNARVVRGVPLDPTGTPLELTNGRVQLSQSSTLWPPPVEPAAAGRPPA